MDELDPAQWRLSLRNDRETAHRRIAIGLGVLASFAGLAIVASVTNDTMLVIATLYAPVALIVGIKRVWSGMTMHAVASYKLRRLERRSNLPPARLVD